jgi:inosine-uridine nucleoside N-ribohydrolase
MPKQAAQQHKGELVLCAVGPLTNVALACKLDVDFPRRLKSFVVMGGAERAGNVTPASEFNFHADPEAAHLVLKKFPRTVRGWVAQNPFSEFPWPPSTSLYHAPLRKGLSAACSMGSAQPG